MVIEWREHEHKGADNEALDHPDTIDTLRQCGLLKYFRISLMRSETSLLQLLIGYWDLDHLLFMVDDEPLLLEVEDIYFLTGLSCQG